MARFVRHRTNELFATGRPSQKEPLRGGCGQVTAWWETLDRGCASLKKFRVKVGCAARWLAKGVTRIHRDPGPRKRYVHQAVCTRTAIDQPPGALRHALFKLACTTTRLFVRGYCTLQARRPGPLAAASGFDECMCSPKHTALVRVQHLRDRHKSDDPWLVPGSSLAPTSPHTRAPTHATRDSSVGLDSSKRT